MIAQILLVMLASLTIVGCDVGTDCGGWYPDPMVPAAPCKIASDCGDPGVCIVPVCTNDVCSYVDAPEGMQCEQCSVYGICVSGTCTDIRRPQFAGTADYSHACDDYDPCTLNWFGEGECYHSALANGAQCEGDTGESGVCGNGLCEVRRELYVDAVCNEDELPSCVGTEPYVVNRLEGSCFWEWCNAGGDSRTLRTKPAGSPCVYPNEPGSPEFIQGQCSPCGTCI